MYVDGFNRLTTSKACFVVDRPVECMAAYPTLYASKELLKYIRQAAAAAARYGMVWYGIVVYVPLDTV